MGLFAAGACGVILSSVLHKCLYLTFLKTKYTEWPVKEERNQPVTYYL